MVFDQLFTAAVTVATLVFTEAAKVHGKKLGEASLEKAGALKQRIKRIFPEKGAAIEPTGQQPEFNQVFLAIKSAAEMEPTIKQAVYELEAAVKNDDSEIARRIQVYIKKSELQAPVFINNTKVADKNVFQGNNTFINPTF